MNLLWRLLWLRLTLRRRGPIGVWDTARTPFRVWPTDLDYLLHMNNSKYLALLDLGRIDLMFRSGYWARASALGWYPVVAGQTITYRKSLLPFQRFDLLTRLLGMDDRWVYVEQTFVRGETVYAQAVIRARWLRRGGGSVTHDELNDLAGSLEGEHPLPDWVREWSAATKAPARTDG